MVFVSVKFKPQMIKIRQYEQINDGKGSWKAKISILRSWRAISLIMDFPLEIILPVN